MRLSRSTPSHLPASLFYHPTLQDFYHAHTTPYFYRSTRFRTPLPMLLLPRTRVSCARTHHHCLGHTHHRCAACLPVVCATRTLLALVEPAPVHTAAAAPCYQHLRSPACTACTALFSAWLPWALTQSGVLPATPLYVCSPLLRFCACMPYMPQHWLVGGFPARTRAAAVLGSVVRFTVGFLRFLPVHCCF